MNKLGICPESSYKCPLCETIYDTYDKTRECISNHPYPETIVEALSCNEMAPMYLMVQMDNGTKMMYQFSHEVED